jgi:UDP:flavonoid glycosyltransferase YjiC (YdhE family)
MGRAGIPQVILPIWLDTYEFAARTEWLGIGAHGSRGAAPSVEASEFSKALTRALDDEKIISRAKEIGNLCRKAEGRELACERLSDWARGFI